MKKKESTPQVNWDDDKLDIQQKVIDFAHIIEQEKYVSGGKSKVYSISASFGVGKTFFCKKLEQVLKTDSIPVSMLNIWEMDFYENPLIPLLIKIQDVYIQYNQIQACTSTTWPILGKIIKKIIKKRYGIDIDKFVNLYNELKPSKSEIYNNYQEFLKELTNLKTLLSSWAKKLDKPVVLIIDELDRCRPDYAIKTLEFLKHFFDISGFVFVLAVDEDQLKNSAEALFGTTNFNGYKRKFINNSFILPAPDKEKYACFLYEKSELPNLIKQIEENRKDLIFKVRRNNYLDYINRNFAGQQNQDEIKKCADFNKLQTTESIIQRYFAAYSILFKFSLRQMEQVFDRLILFSKSILNTNELFSPDLAVLLVCVHEFDLKIYNELKNNNFITPLSCTIDTIATGPNSIAYTLYKEKATYMLDKLNRNIVPKVPVITDFSTTDSTTNPINVIKDNVDRFFIKDSKTPLKWLLDADINSNKNPIDNACRIGIVIHSKSESRWEESVPDIDNASNFNLDKFRQNYFDRMDFIANFSTKKQQNQTDKEKEYEI